VVNLASFQIPFGQFYSLQPPGIKLEDASGMKTMIHGAGVPYRSCSPGAFNTPINELMSSWYEADIAQLLGSDGHLQHTPPTNVTEKQDVFVLEMIAVGRQKEDFTITVRDGYLVVASEKDGPKMENDERYTRREFSLKPFKRVFKLPKNVDASGLQAKYDQGVLRVSLPKVTPTPIEHTVVVS
jgi:HSP20 family protein